MAGTRRLAFNVVMNWVAMAVNMVVPFFLTPFVVRHLGAVGYGVWILAVSTVAYLSLLDLGLRSAVIRFVSKAQAKGDLGGAKDAVEAALWFRVLVAGGVAVLSLLLASAVPYVFKIPPALVRAAQITTLLYALGVGITLISGVFGAVLAAYNRFDLLSMITVGQTVVRAAGVLLLLKGGHGLVPLACWDLVIPLLVAFATVFFATKVFPESRVRPSRPDMAVLRTIWAYSFTSFVFMIAVQIITGTDNLVVGAFVSADAVAIYAIGGSLLGYAYQASQALSTTFTPMASNLEASGQFERLQTMLLRGTQATLGLALPIAIALAFRGGTFITLWIGPQFGRMSETVLRILLISMFFGVGDGTAGSIMMAIEKHKPVARWAVYEAILNLGLSIVLVKTIGMYGVAWGTSISMVLTHLAFYPRYIHRVLGVRPWTYIVQGWGKIVLCAVPFAVASMLAERFWHPQHLITFFLQIAATLPVYGICVLAMFWKELATYYTRWRAARAPRMVDAAAITS